MLAPKRPWIKGEHSYEINRPLLSIGLMRCRIGEQTVNIIVLPSLSRHQSDAQLMLTKCEDCALKTKTSCA